MKCKGKVHWSERDSIKQESLTRYPWIIYCQRIHSMRRICNFKPNFYHLIVILSLILWTTFVQLARAIWVWLNFILIYRLMRHLLTSINMTISIYWRSLKYRPYQYNISNIDYVEYWFNSSQWHILLLIYLLFKWAPIKLYQHLIYKTWRKIFKIQCNFRTDYSKFKKNFRPF